MSIRTAHTIGTKYAETADLDIAAVARLIRKDLKAAQNDEHNPIPAEATTRVRISRYSMGQSINVTITLPDRPARVPGTDPRSAAYGLPDAGIYGSTSTTEAVAIVEAGNAIVWAYNYDNSDSLTDYSDNKFFGFVNVDGTRD